MNDDALIHTLCIMSCMISGHGATIEQAERYLWNASENSREILRVNSARRLRCLREQGVILFIPERNDPDRRAEIKQADHDV